MLTANEYREAEFGYSLAESRHGFRVHATIYAVVMIGLIVLNAALIAFTDANFPWVIFPLVGWGIGLTFHYVYGYRRAPVQIRDRHRKIVVPRGPLGRILHTARRQVALGANQLFVKRHFSSKSVCYGKGRASTRL